MGSEMCIRDSNEAVHMVHRINLREVDEDVKMKSSDDRSVLDLINYGRRTERIVPVSHELQRELCGLCPDLQLLIDGLEELFYAPLPSGPPPDVMPGHHSHFEAFIFSEPLPRHSPEYCSQKMSKSTGRPECYYKLVVWIGI